MDHTVFCRLPGLLFLTIGILLTTTSCQRPGGGDYFEGEIEYQIIYKTRDPNFSLTELARLQGNRMVMTFKEGDFVQEYFNSQGRSVRKSIRLKDEHRYYLQFPDLDTTYFTDTRYSGHETTFTLLGSQRILGYPCREVHSVAIPKAEYPHFERIDTRFFIATDLAIDPAWYANYRDGGFDHLAELLPGCMLAILKTNDLYDMEIIATEVRPGRVDKKIFTVDRDKVFLDALAR